MPGLEVVQAHHDRGEVVPHVISPMAPHGFLEEHDTTINGEGRQVARSRVPSRSEPSDSVGHPLEVGEVVCVVARLEHEPLPVLAPGIVGTDLAAWAPTL